MISMFLEQPDYNRELRDLRAQLERAAERSTDPRQKELLTRTASNVGRAVDAEIGEDTKALLLKSGSTVLRSVISAVAAGRSII
jgi:hypothetical protein